MTVGEIETFFAYNAWANRRLLEAAASLRPEEQTRDLGSSHRSIRGTLFHLIFSEWDWLQLWRGVPWNDIIQQEPPEEDFPTITALQDRWRAIAEEERAFIQTLTDTVLNKPVSFTNFQGEQWEFSPAQMIQHVVNHSSYHRGQVVTLLRQLGRIPPTTDFLIFELERQQWGMSVNRVT